MTNIERTPTLKEVFPTRRVRWGYHRLVLDSILAEVSVLSMANPQDELPPEPENLLFRQYIAEHAQPTTAAALELVDRVQRSLAIEPKELIKEEF